MHTELAWVAVAPAFALICIGIAVRRAALVDAAFWPSAEKLTHYVLFPAFLVHSIGLAGPLDASSKSTIVLLTALTLVVLAAVVL
ncbi:AEC family transporter, partial [Pseudomonas sp. MWU12-2115]